MGVLVAAVQGAVESPKYAVVRFVLGKDLRPADTLPSLEIFENYLVLRKTATASVAVVRKELVLEDDREGRISERLGVELRDVRHCRSFFRPGKTGHGADPLAVVVHMARVRSDHMYGVGQKILAGERR